MQDTERKSVFCIIGAFPGAWNYRREIVKYSLRKLIQMHQMCDHQESHRHMES